MVSQQVELEKTTVCVVGLGYVGLPLALAYGRTGLKTIGFDIDCKRVEELKRGVDSTEEITPEEIKNSHSIFSSDERLISEADFIIVAVPTPVNKANQPELSLIERASETVGKNLSKGAIVVYESTVYPGVTEDICAPILEKYSGLKCGRDFKIGYSPERINPGDQEHTLEKIVKVVAGIDVPSTARIAEVYRHVCLAGVHVAPNIKTAEAAKVIENTQRDLNIALINELSLIFHRLGIDTQDVLEAAGTKWNFLKFTPGLVGGHCIGVDPYYLVYKAEELGYHAQVITAGRQVNDFMPEFVAEQTLHALIEAGKNIRDSKVLVMGLTFKENVKDVRNSKITVAIAKLLQLGVKVIGFDPLLDQKETEEEFGIPVIARLEGHFDAVIVSAPHQSMRGIDSQILGLMNGHPVLIDVKGIYRHLRDTKNLIYKTL